MHGPHLADLHSVSLSDGVHEDFSLSTSNLLGSRSLPDEVDG